MKFEEVRLMLTNAGNVIRNYESKMGKLKEIEGSIDRCNSSDIVDDSRQIKDKVSKYKRANLKDYNDAVGIVNEILSLDPKYSSILYDIYIVGKKEKELDQLKVASKSTINRRHLEGLSLLSIKYNVGEK